MTRAFNRNDAYSIEIVDPAANGQDPIQSFVEADGSLFAFAGKCTFEILPAEKIDPKNTHPETRHSYQRVFSVGAENSYLARTIIQSKSLLDSTALRAGLEKNEIINHVWNCTKLLLACETSFYHIYSQTMELAPQCDEIIEKSKQGKSIPPLPQVADLYHHVTSFLGNAKRFLEKTHEILCIFYGAPNAEANFNSYKTWMSKNFPQNLEVNNLLEQDEEWIRHIAWCRNALDINHSKPHFKVEIQNLKLHPGNKFSSPGWRYDFTGKGKGKQDKFSDIIRDMDVYMSNMLMFFEELFLFSLKDNWDKRFDFGLFRKAEEDIDPKCPIVYCISFNRDTSKVKPENS